MTSSVLSKQLQFTRAKGSWLFVGVCLLYAACLRYRFCFAELWLDEIWSLCNVLQVQSWMDIFTVLRIDNNHPLVSLYLYAFGLQSHWFYYHLLSLFTGIGTVFVLWRIAAAEEQKYALIVLLLASFSFVLINYSSEARGYAPAAFFNLIAFHAISAFVLSPNRQALTLYSLAGILSLLSSLTSVIVLISLAIWSGWELSAKYTLRRSFKEFFKAHVFLGSFIVLYYFFFVSRLSLGGGNDFTYTNVLLRFFSFFFGVHGNVFLVVVSSIVFIGIYCYSLFSLFQQKKNSLIVLHLCIFPVVPFCILLFLEPYFLYFRYFFVCVPFLLLLFANGLLRLFRHGGAGRIIFFAIICGYIAGNIWAVVYFENNGGRGKYLEAVTYIQEHSTQEPITASSDHDLRNGLVLQFYTLFVPQSPKIQYVKQNKVRTPPEWYIRHQYELDEATLQRRIHRFGAAYNLVRIFPYSHLSGFYWLLYTRG